MLEFPTFLAQPLLEATGWLAQVPLLNEYASRPFLDVGAWKFCFIAAFISAILLTVVFAKVADHGIESELSIMFKMLLISTPVLMVIYRVLLL